MPGPELTIFLEPGLKDWLESEARRQNKSAECLAEEAIRATKERGDYRRQMIEAASAEADKGSFVSEERMTEWFDSLGGENELPEPQSDVILR